MSPPPILLVVVDTEEEFDWSAPFARDNTSVHAMADIHRSQEICDRFGIRPVYVMDYPIATQEEGWLPLKEFVEDGRAVIGAHLHPWVSPPFIEELTIANTFPGNLPAELEEEKLTLLTRQIQTVIGKKPKIYKAGRYGFGPNTPAILEKLGYEIDLSPSPPFDFGPGHGPDFSRTSNHPQRITPGGGIFSFPATGDYVGRWATSRRHAHRLHRLASTPLLSALRLPGILSRFRLLERIRLSPEGHSPDELERLTVALIRRGLNVFSLTLHSPTLRPGCTPYVKNKEDLNRFLKTLGQYFHFFINSLGGIALTPLELKMRLEALTPHCGLAMHNLNETTSP
ncbi:MAG: WalW protein [Magnetococcales bacterium]|nr:WalW protein [Magnetococcales bacterium]HIJ85755.1 WalW protein [Magnetococcales bacterium]